MIAVSADGREKTYAMYESSKEEIVLPRLQNSLVFPDFENDLTSKKEEISLESSEESIVEICTRISADFQKLAIALSKIKLT